MVWTVVGFRSTKSVGTDKSSFKEGEVMKRLLMLSIMALFLLVMADWGRQATAGITAIGPDRYKCYKAKGAIPDPQPTVGVEDEFETDQDTVGKPVLICNPASKDDSKVFFPAVHQLCYKIKGQHTLDSLTVRVRNQFTSPQGQDLIVNTEEKFLCVPGSKTCLDAQGQPIDCPNEPFPKP
jgi:hypothetical protein